MESSLKTCKTKIAKGYFSVAETSAYTGISERTIREYLINPVNPLPHYRLGITGRIIRISKNELEQWLQQFRVQANCFIDKIINEISNEKEKK